LPWIKSSMYYTGIVFYVHRWIIIWKWLYVRVFRSNQKTIRYLCICGINMRCRYVKNPLLWRQNYCSLIPSALSSSNALNVCYTISNNIAVHSLEKGETSSFCTNFNMPLNINLDTCVIYLNFWCDPGIVRFFENVLKFLN